MEDSKNDWDKDSGYVGWNSYLQYDKNYAAQGFYRMYAGFYSKPLDINSNSRKNLGISKGETFFKCYVGEADAIDSVSPFETDISLAKFSTDVARRIDTSAIEIFASNIALGICSAILLLV